MMIEGESLLNDGVAILLYEIFAKLAVGQVESIAVEVTVSVLKIALGGPALGFTMGKLAVLWLSTIFNDAGKQSYREPEVLN
jgi:sodium/hydrogen exchanger 10/11